MIMHNNDSNESQQNNFSDYIVYVDESGDHSLQNIDKEYPIFVLAFCIFKKDAYLELIKKITAFKFKYFGHDKVIFHENDIRRKMGDFKMFNKEVQESFMQEYWQIINEVEFTVIATVIKKLNLKEKYTNPDNPYHLSMKFCLERVNNFLKKNGDHNNLTYIVVEQRGKNEDAGLELEFRRVCQNLGFNFRLRMASKQSNCAGLQIADILARPIGIKVLRPEQLNRGFSIIEKKLKKNIYNSYNGSFLDYNGSGLKIFP